MSGTVAFSDLYGAKAPGRTVGMNEVQPVANASGAGAAESDKKTPALFWIGLVACLILVRLAWEAAK